MGSIINALLNAVSVSRNHKGLFSEKDWKDISKTLISGVVMGGAVFLMYSILAPFLYGTVMGSIALCAGCGAVGCVIYFVLCYALKVEVFKSTVDAFFKKG